MTEIEDRGITFYSYKRYAKALQAEVSCLQQFLTEDRVQKGFKAFEKEAKTNE